MLIYSDASFQVKTRPGVRFFGQIFQAGYKMSAASGYLTGNYTVWPTTYK